MIQSWIPDETALVFQYWEEQVALDEPIWSYILFEDGRSTQLGSRIQDISWSIDEPNKLVYFSEFEGIYLVDINQIEMSNQLLQGIDATNGSLSWHPDGQYIAIAGNRRNNVPLWMLDLSTKQLTEMRSGEFGDQLVRWSPNGKSLLWVTNNQVKILGFRENNFTELESFQFSTYLIKSPEYPWLSDSNYFGLIFTSASSPDRDLCFYSIFGEKVGCPFQTNDIRNQADLDETNLELAITWSP